MFEWFDKHPAKSIITYTVFIGGTVFAISKFLLIDKAEIEYSVQLETKEAIISQYEEKIRFLERENTSLEAEKNKYLDWIENTPGSLQYLEKENEDLKEKLEQINQNSNTGGSTQYSPYLKEYDGIKENTSVIDEETGIVVSVKDISTKYDGTLFITVPGDKMKKIENVSSGFTEEYTINDKKYQLIVSSIDFITSKYSIVIKQLEKYETK